MAAIIAATAAAFIPKTEAANGDPVARLSAVTRVSNPEPRDIAEIRINAGRLLTTPRGTYTGVTVEYALENTSGKDFRDIYYGIPIDYYGEGDAHIDNCIAESAYMRGLNSRNIRNETFSINGRALPYAVSDVAVASAERSSAVEVEQFSRSFPPEHTIRPYVAPLPRNAPSRYRHL